MSLDNEEAINLQKEFDWVLKVEVHPALDRLRSILEQCVMRFPPPVGNSDHTQKVEKYVLSSNSDLIKCAVSLVGDCIIHADINIKIQRQQTTQYKTSLQSSNPWRLHQLRDAGNHLHQALLHLDHVDKDCIFKSGEEVLHVLGNTLGCLQRCRTSILVPRKRTIDELMKSRNMKCLLPSLPEDLVASFYIQNQNLVFAIYQVSNAHGAMKFDTLLAETSISWLNELLVLVTVALQLGQQLKDKINVFSQYKDFTPELSSSNASSSG